MNITERKKRNREAMAPFSDEQLAQIIVWIEAKIALRTIEKKCENELLVPVSYSTLSRWNRDRKAIELEEETGELSETARELNRYAVNGEAGLDGTGFSAATLLLIEKQAFKLATDLSTLSQEDFGRFKELFRMKLTHEKAQSNKAYTEHRIQYHNQRLELAKEKLALQKRALELRETKKNQASSEQQNPKPERPGDHLGPYARNLDEIEERAFRKFGFPESEWPARRARARKDEAELEKQLAEFGSPIISTSNQQ